MHTTHSGSRPSRRPATLRLAAALSLGLVLGACGSDQPTAPTAATPAPATTAPAQPTPATAVSNKVAAMGVDDLRAAASKAYAENRLYAPAEDNAVEYYLALRDKAPGDAAVSSALTDLLPMTVIAIEQSVNRDDFTEALRLSALLEKADPQHPALARLKSSITQQQATAAQRAQQLSEEEEAKRQQELEERRLADQKQQQEEAAKKLAAQQSAEKAAADKAAADKAAADRAAAERAAETRVAEQRPAPAQPATASASDLRPISMPAPRYPTDALRAGTSGSVLVEYTVGTDGTVTAARVVRSNPSRIFDRPAVDAVRRWRFQPVASPVTTRREISFNPQG